MEPVSLGVGIASAISASLSIGQGLKRLTHQYRDAPGSYEHAVKQCDAVQGQLSMLQRLMLNETWSKPLGNDGSTSDYFVTIVMNCAETLLELEECVSLIKAGAVNTEASGLSLRQRGRFFWREDEIKTYCERLQTSKNDIGLVLSVLQTESLALIQGQMEQQFAQLRVSMNSLARSNSTKYRAMRISGVSSDSKVVVAPTNIRLGEQALGQLASENSFNFSQQSQSLGETSVSLSDIDLSSVILPAYADEAPGHTAPNLLLSTRSLHRSGSIRSVFSKPRSEFSRQTHVLVDWVEQERANLNSKLAISEKDLDEVKQQLHALKTSYQQIENIMHRTQRNYEERQFECDQSRRTIEILQRDLDEANQQRLALKPHRPPKKPSESKTVAIRAPVIKSVFTLLKIPLAPWLIFDPLPAKSEFRLYTKPAPIVFITLSALLFGLHVFLEPGSVLRRFILSTFGIWNTIFPWHKRTFMRLHILFMLSYYSSTGYVGPLIGLGFAEGLNNIESDDHFWFFLHGIFILFYCLYVRDSTPFFSMLFSPLLSIVFFAALIDIRWASKVVMSDS